MVNGKVNIRYLREMTEDDILTSSVILQVFQEIPSLKLKHFIHVTCQKVKKESDEP